MALTYGVIFLFCGACQIARSEDVYNYNFKMPEHYASLLTRMDHGMQHRMEEMGRAMEKHCPTSRMAAEYETIISQLAGSLRRTCLVSEDVADMKVFKEGIKTSRQECLSKADCQTELAETTAKILTTIQELDGQALKDYSACNGDETCKKQVEGALLESLSKLYLDAYPNLRIVSDKSIANTKCYSTMLQCMIDSNTDRMKKMYSRMAKIQECVSNAISSKSIWY